MTLSTTAQDQSKAPMPSFETRYSPEHDVIIVHLKDVFSKQAVHDYAQTIMDQSREHDCKNILLDARGKSLCLSTVDIYQLPSVLSEYEIDRSFWHAILVNPDQNEYKFFETVAFNRSYRVRVFHDQTLALNWLGYGQQGFIL